MQDARHRPHVAIAAFVAAFSVSSGAAAEEERTDARAAYDDAARAYEARDFLRAAEGFARADSLAPNALALKLALAAALQADAPVLAEELALRAESRDASPDVQDLARSGHRLAKHRVGKLEIVCATPAAVCIASVGGRELRGGQSAVMLRGPVVVSFTSGDGKVSTVTVEVAADATTRALEPPLPRALMPSAPSPQPSRGGLPPAVFWIGTGLTAALAGATVVSGIDANARYDDFSTQRTSAAREDGKSAELRTNILLGGAVVVALVTGVIGIWRTRWSDRAPESR